MCISYHSLKISQEIFLLQDGIIYLYLEIDIMKLNAYKTNILDWYNSGIKIKEIAVKMKCHTDSIRKFLNRNGITTPTHSEANRRYVFNEHFFDIIDTEEKAYILGLFAADGYNQENKITISLVLQERDKHILDQISNLMNSNRPLYFLNKKKYNEKYQNCYRLDFTSKIISNRLKELGCYQGKSLTLKFPDINKKLWRHYIRGYFDGDGCICYSKTKKGYISNMISFVGSKYHCYRLKEILFSWNINSQILYNKKYNKNIRILQFGGRNQVSKFYKILYNKSNIFLFRKSKKFKEFFKITNKYLIKRKSNNVYNNIKGCENPWRVVKHINQKSITIGTYFSYEDAKMASFKWDKSHNKSVLLL